ncbi:MAG TPA: hypothetical protein VLC95_03235, partial [Anaerolineae bacterium]|nr:hypothetical protein [Anaerolineae bacterium]
MKRIALLLIALAVLAGCAGMEPTSPPPAATATSAAPLPTTVPTQPASPTAEALPSATATSIPTEAPPTATMPPATAAPPDVAFEAAVIVIRDGDLWLKPLPEGEEMQLTDLGDVVDFPEFSPDGTLVLFRREGPSVTVSPTMPDQVPTSTWWAVPVTGGSPRMLLDPLAVLPQVPGSGGLEPDLFPSEPGPFDWLPGERQLLFTTRYLTINGLPGNYDLWRLDVESGQLDELLPAGQGGRPVVSPDGESVLLSTPTDILVARADGSERQTLLSFERVPTYSEWEWVPAPAW